MHNLKEQAVMMKEALLKGDLDKIGQILDFGWQNRRTWPPGITNHWIDEIYTTAIRNGATGGKVPEQVAGDLSFFIVQGNTRFKVIDALSGFKGQTKRYEFTTKGLSAYTI